MPWYTLIVPAGVIASLAVKNSYAVQFCALAFCGFLRRQNAGIFCLSSALLRGTFALSFAAIYCSDHLLCCTSIF